MTTNGKAKQTGGRDGHGLRFSIRSIETYNEIKLNRTRYNFSTIMKNILRIRVYFYS